MKSKEEILHAIALASALARSTLAQTAFVPGPIPTAIKMLDAIEERIRNTAWPPRNGAFNDVSIGLYAVRNLEEIGKGSLSTALCVIDNALKDR